MKPLRIGSVVIDTPVVLAPMAGVTDLPYRLLCREQGAGLLCMEMVSAKAITYHNRNTAALMETDPAEQPVSLQLFGSEPAIMEEAARMIDDLPFAILDINMGCPVPKIVNNGEGSALMKDPELAAGIVRAVVRGSTHPVTVKFRKGFDEANINAVEFARRMEDAGAAAVTVHGRTREQYYSGKADHDIIRRVKEAVTIPVIGNGDIDSAEAAKKCFEETGCDAVMIGRAAEGNPWIFSEVVSYLKDGTIPERPTKAEVADMILRHATLQLKYKGEYIGMREMRKHVAWYLSGFPHAAMLRKRACEITEYAQIEEIAEIVRDLTESAHV